MRSYGIIIATVISTLITGNFGVELEKSTQHNDSVYKFVNNRQNKAIGSTNSLEILKCVKDFNVGCLLDKSEDFLINAQRKFSVEADSQTEVGRKSGDDKPSALIESISSLVSEITDVIFKTGITGFFRDAKEDDSEESSEIEEDDDDDEDEEPETKGIVEGRGRKKNSIEARKKKIKKKDKIRATIKLLVLGIIVFGKLTLLLKLLSAHLQIKFLIIAFVGLLINAAKFYLDLKKGHQPQKVIYYEHAQHQHHYENDEDWSGGGGGHGSGGYWARAYDKEEDKENGSQVAASAQDLAYSQQKPFLNYNPKLEDTPSVNPFSWF